MQLEVLEKETQIISLCSLEGKHYSSLQDYRKATTNETWLI